MKLSDGTVLVVRQAPPDKLEALKWFLQHTMEQRADIGDERVEIRFASAMQPYTSAKNALELRAIMRANSNDVQRIGAAVFGISITEVPEWIKNANSGSPSDVA